ncbi:hypothetical protein CJO81_03070 [Ralstonia solanacearum]|uniref:hypothetical protein n=1 Tax=Ralstonia pseudosolanacearum TaxID=1310165 RepID=UPI000E57D262|nr:hypothetical protein [Ralstonia pseudosolanacearum]AXV99829.1 hypothetical protein CJO81_03070 [Ralstonia solanacearum]AXW27319.1 hypothetical protein CJO87_03065 [Ralstonia solanacearum]UYR06917.1 hypothetical protein NQS38_00740 [Ralstonia pseudosolanacearum]
MTDQEKQMRCDEDPKFVEPAPEGWRRCGWALLPQLEALRRPMTEESRLDAFMREQVAIEEALRCQKPGEPLFL